MYSLHTFQQNLQFICMNSNILIFIHIGTTSNVVEMLTCIQC